MLVIVGHCNESLFSMSPACRLERQWQRHPQRLLVAEAGLVVSDDMIDWLADNPGMVLTSPEGRFLAVSGEIDAEADLRRRFEEGCHQFGRANAATLSDVYVRKLRRRLTPLAVSLNDQSPKLVERQLFASVYKGITDVVTKYAWPEPAFWATRLCAAARITPNLITMVGLGLTILTAWFFFHGEIAAGLASAWLMTFLDTLDGKLARVTVTSSRLGNILDHGNDLIHPPLWWLCLAYGLERIDPSPWLWPSCWVILACYVIGRVLEIGFKAHFGFNQFMWRPFDGRFRLVIARRNIILLLVTAGLIIAQPTAGFMAAALWSILSVLIALWRVIAAHLASRRQPIVPWIS